MSEKFNHQHFLQQIKQNVDLVRGQPSYVYSEKFIKSRVTKFSSALTDRFQILYSVKANPFHKILSLMQKLGIAPDISSGGELLKALECGFSTQEMSFVGPGKTENELYLAIERQVGTLVVESKDELILANRIAEKLGKTICISVRVHPREFISSNGRLMQRQPSAFGIEEEALTDVIDLARSLTNVKITGIHVHTGSMYLNAELIVQNFLKTASLADRFQKYLGADLEQINFGGGFGIPYRQSHTELDMDILNLKINEILKKPELQIFGEKTRFFVESGRYLVGPAGAYVTQVLYKKKSFGQTYVVVDGGMNHHLAGTGFGQTLRSSFPISTISFNGEQTKMERVRIVGSSCYSMDVLADEVELPHLAPGDLIVIFQSGAYGPSFSPSGFLSRNEARELMF